MMTPEEMISDYHRRYRDWCARNAGNMEPSTVSLMVTLFDKLDQLEARIAKLEGFGGH